jgi:endonuclease YncB( thermonuclease family)
MTPRGTRWIRKAPIIGAFLFWAFAVAAQAFEARVSNVLDGDTVVLSTGDKVRVIGINAPETHEPLGDDATRALAVLVANRPLQVVTGPERRDRYGRTLAYLDVAGQDAGLALVRQGLAAAVAFPPNTSRLDQYLTVEREARGARRGLWGNAYFAPRDATSPDAITEGFGFYRGTVSRVGGSKKYVYLDLGEHLAVRVSHANWRRYFAGQPDDWLGKTVTVRGWVNRDGKIEVRHPAMIEQNPYNSG